MVGDLLAGFGRAPGQLFDERNLVAHLDEVEGDPRRRPLTVDELEAFFGACEARIETTRRRGRKGSLQAWRDQALFKIAFGWGLRRAEVAMLDIGDFRPAAVLPMFGAYGQVHVRYGKAKGGGGPQRRTVLSVFDWAVEVVEQYVAEIRRRLAARTSRRCLSPSAAPGSRWDTSTSGSLSRTEAGLDAMLTPHCLRHSYVTHLAELGWASRFIQDQVGHSRAATTAIYLSMSDDVKDRLVRRAIDDQLDQLGRPR